MNTKAGLSTWLYFIAPCLCPVLAIPKGSKLISGLYWLHESFHYCHTLLIHVVQYPKRETIIIAIIIKQKLPLYYTPPSHTHTYSQCHSYNHFLQNWRTFTDHKTYFEFHSSDWSRGKYIVQKIFKVQYSWKANHQR